MKNHQKLLIFTTFFIFFSNFLKVATSTDSAVIAGLGLNMDDVKQTVELLQKNTRESKKGILSLLSFFPVGTCETAKI